MNTPQPGDVCWLHGRVIIVGTVGTKNITGLIVEADGWHTIQVSLREKLPPALYHGKPYPARRMRGHLRKQKAQTKSARKILNSLLDAA